MIDGYGYPAAVIVNELVVPMVNEADVALVNAGVPSTVIVSIWVALPRALVAVRLTWTGPAAAVGVPEMVAVPFPLLVSDSPAGRPVALMVALG
jgi:hypothetical protein